MNLNATLLAQVLVFAFLVWFTMRYIWPLLLKALEEREQRVAGGLAAADEGHRVLAEARHKQAELVEEGRSKAEAIVGQAQRRGTRIVEEARHRGEELRETLIADGHAEVERERTAARCELGERLSSVALLAAERILERELDRTRHAEMLHELAREFSS